MAVYCSNGKLLSGRGSHFWSLSIASPPLRPEYTVWPDEEVDAADDDLTPAHETVRIPPRPDGAVYPARQRVGLVVGIELRREVPLGCRRWCLPAMEQVARIGACAVKPRGPTTTHRRFWTAGPAGPVTAKTSCCPQLLGPAAGNLVARQPRRAAHRAHPIVPAPKANRNAPASIATCARSGNCQKSDANPKTRPEISRAAAALKIRRRLHQSASRIAQGVK